MRGLPDFDVRLHPVFASALDRRRLPGETLKDALLREVDESPASVKRIIGAVGVNYPPQQVETLVVGAGFHAAVYAANRPPDSVHCFDDALNLGGLGSIFGLAERPVFYLNSRNRPEADYRRPGSPGPLNSIVGGLLQPSELNMLEYQSQAELALAIRINLANTAKMSPYKMQKISLNPFNEYRYRATFYGGNTVAKRIIVATGLGEAVMPVKPSQRIWSFTDFLKRMGNVGSKYPLRGYKRVAIIGTGDSGKVVAEWFLGLGPQPGLSNAAEDFVDRIVWIGQDNRTKEDWEACERSRYIGLGRSFPRSGQLNYYYRIQPEPGRAVRAVGGSKTVRVDWVGPQGQKSGRFDLAIFCTGFENRVMDLLPDFAEPEVYEVDGIPVARRIPSEEIYFVGPCANLELEEREVNPRISIPENSASVFRYADKTALLARSANRQITRVENIQVSFTVGMPDRLEALRAKVEANKKPRRSGAL